MLKISSNKAVEQKLVIVAPGQPKGLAEKAPRCFFTEKSSMVLLYILDF